jgi:xylulokinase
MFSFVDRQGQRSICKAVDSLREQAMVLGIDVGTSGTKVIAVSDNGEVLDSATEGYPLLSPQVGWAEQNPEDWWIATVRAVRTVLQRVEEKGGPRKVASIGFSGQMHGLVPLDADGEVIRPSLVWCDLRSAAQAEQMEREIGREQIISWTENPPLPNFTITKLLWMKQHEPEAFNRIQRILLPKDYVRLRMTGEFYMDLADASGTLLLDVAHRRWSKEMCNATGIPMNWLPDLCESSDIAGFVTADASRTLGIPEGTPVVAGAGDQAAGAVGLGVTQPGTVSVIFGTSGVVLTTTNRPVRDPKGRLHTFCHANANSWFVMGVTQTAGGALQWYCERFEPVSSLVGSSKDSVYSSLMQEAEGVPVGAEALLFLPYLMGERTPHLNPNARGAWIGLTWRHRRSHLVRALLEGVSFSLRDCWEVMSDLGIRATDWRVSGGGAQGPLWMSIFSSVVNKSIEIVRGGHGPAYGAAVLAAQGVGILPREDSNQWLGQGDVVHPVKDWIEGYEALYPIFKQAYHNTRELADALCDWQSNHG